MSSYNGTYFKESIFMDYGNKKCSAYILGHTLNMYMPYENNDMLTQLSVTPIRDALTNNNEDEAVSLTVRLIKDVALLLKKQRSSSHSTSTSRPSSTERKTSSSKKPTRTKKRLPRCLVTTNKLLGLRIFVQLR